MMAAAQVTQLTGRVGRHQQDHLSSLPLLASPHSVSPTTLISEDFHDLSTKSKAVVVQWSAHPTWYPKLLPALPKFLILSLKGREVVGSNPTHGDSFLIWRGLRSRRMVSFCCSYAGAQLFVSSIVFFQPIPYLTRRNFEAKRGSGSRLKMSPSLLCSCALFHGRAKAKATGDLSSPNDTTRQDKRRRAGKRTQVLEGR
jgi:hypothetical protein